MLLAANVNGDPMKRPNLAFFFGPLSSDSIMAYNDV